MVLEKQDKELIILKDENENNIKIIDNLNMEVSRLSKRVIELEDVIKNM